MISSHVCIGLKLCFVCVLVVYLMSTVRLQTYLLQRSRGQQKICRRALYSLVQLSEKKYTLQTLAVNEPGNRTSGPVTSLPGEPRGCLWPYILPSHSIYCTVYSRQSEYHLDIQHLHENAVTKVRRKLVLISFHHEIKIFFLCLYILVRIFSTLVQFRTSKSFYIFFVTLLPRKSIFKLSHSLPFCFLYFLFSSACVTAVSHPSYMMVKCSQLAAYCFRD